MRRPGYRFPCNLVQCIWQSRDEPRRESPQGPARLREQRPGLPPREDNGKEVPASRDGRRYVIPLEEQHGEQRTHVQLFDDYWDYRNAA